MIAYVLEGLVAVLLAVTVGYCYILDKQLRALRSGQDGLKAIIEGLDGATARAQASIADLRGTASVIGQDLGERVSKGRVLADELALMVDAGNALADRLEGTRSNKPPVRDMPKVVPKPNMPAAPQEASADETAGWEEALLKALREAR